MQQSEPRSEMSAWDPDADHRRMSPAWARYIPVEQRRHTPIYWPNVLIWWVVVPVGTVVAWGLIGWAVWSALAQGGTP